MIHATDLELRAIGWSWALRDAKGKLLAVTSCPECVSSWDDRNPNKDLRIIALRHLNDRDCGDNCTDDNAESR